MHDYQGMGPLPAVFDPEKITFIWAQTAEVTFNYKIDRLTGNVSAISSNGTQFPKIFTCHVGKPQF
jgi:hypothetical protein